jgi:DNA-binding transcriptional LysR family regulator
MPATSKTDAPGIVAQSLGQWGILVALHDQHPLTVHTSITIDMLAAQPLILYEAHDDQEQLFLTLSHKLGADLQVAHRSGSTLSVLAIAATGLGVALVPAPLRQVTIPGLVYRRLDDADLNANLMLVSRAQEPNAAAAAYLALSSQPSA